VFQPFLGGAIVAERLLQDDAPGLAPAGIGPFTTAEKREGGISR